MLRCVHDHPQKVAEFVASRIPHCHNGFGKCHAMGVIDDEGKLIAGVVYNNWNREAEIMEMSAASITPHWLTRDVLHQIYWYPYLRCGCQMTVMQVPAENRRLIYLLSRYGYELTLFPRLYGRERDGMICRLTVERWAANKFNQQHRRDTAPVEEAA